MKRTISLLLIITLAFSCSKEKRSDKAGEKMQDFVVDISNYAKEFDADFIVIPQNGVELGFNYLDQTEGLNTTYLAAINGIGMEELFYNGSAIASDERLTMLQDLKASKKILVADYISDNSSLSDVIQKNENEGFLSFPRLSSNYDYMEIPTFITNENANDIQTLNDAQNYLYLISTNSFTTKAEMINAINATNFDVVIIDLFFDDAAFTASEITQLKTKQNGGKRLLISYMNIGSAENYRYYWKDKWKLHHPNWLKKEYEGYEDEIWVKFWKKDWQEIIFGNDESYTKRIINAGFDGVYLDNVEAYYFLYFE